MTRVNAEILEYLKTDWNGLKWLDGELVNVSQPSNRIWILENTRIFKSIPTNSARSPRVHHFKITKYIENIPFQRAEQP